MTETTEQEIKKITNTIDQEIKKIEQEIEEVQSTAGENTRKLIQLKNQKIADLKAKKQSDRLAKFLKDSVKESALLNLLEKRNPECARFRSQKKQYERLLKEYLEFDREDMEYGELTNKIHYVNRNYKDALTILNSEINLIGLQTSIYNRLEKLEKKAGIK